MSKIFAYHNKYSQLKYTTIFSWFILLYAMIILALPGLNGKIFKDLHLVLDISNGILSLLFALFLLANQSNIQPNFRKYLAIGFGFTATTELLHALVGIEWLNWPAWIGIYADKLWPATWSPSTYVLPIALTWAIWLMRRNSALRPGIYASGMAVITAVLFILAFILPQYVNTGLLGIQRPTQITVLFLLLVLIVSSWRERARSPLFEGLAWMAVLLFLSNFFMLYSTSTLEGFAIMAHVGKLMAYTFLHVIQMRLAAENSRARMEAEASLLLEKKNLREAMDKLVFHQFAIDQHSIVGNTDTQGNITYANDSFCTVSGYSHEELIGQNHRILKSDVHSAEFFRDMYRTIAAGSVWKGEICNRAKDGRLYWVMTTIVPVMNDKGKPEQYISMRSEITERKRVETELIRYRDNLEELVAEQILDLKQAKETAEAASRAKSEFLANMSHEIRTPMNGVVGVIDILQETQLSPAQQRMVNTIRTSSLALLGILGDILDLSKIEAGKLEIERIPVNLRELVEGVAQVLSPTVAYKDMDLIVFLPSDIPAWVRTDPGRLRQILFNLLSNAVKFTQSDGNCRGRVLLRVENKSLADGRAGLNFRIIDNGIGMAEETIGQLFRSFAQADATTTRRFGGTGLGLSISKHLAQLLHGQIQVSSILGRGTEFSLELPLEVAPASHAAVIFSELLGMKVLIVTDHVVYEEVLPAYLSSVGMQIKLAANHQAVLNDVHQLGESDWVVLFDRTRVSEINSEIENSIALPVVQLVSRRVSATTGNEYTVLANPLLLDDLVHTLAIASGRISVADIVQKTEPRHHARKPVPSREDAVASGRLLLVAEDNEINCEVILEQLRILGFSAESAKDGCIALEMWRSGRYSLLFTDCHMPNLDGFGLAAAIRKEEQEGEHLPIIAVTGNAMQGAMQRCLSSGMDDYLSKPLRLSDLDAKLARWLPQRQADIAAVTVSEAPQTAECSLPAGTASVPDAANIVWDRTTLARMVGDHPAMHRRLLDKFLLGAEEQVAAIISAAAVGDLVTVTGVAHKLKSAARTVGALRLGNLCQELEISGRAGDIGAVKTHASGLEITFLKVAEQIKNSYSRQL